ncbi:cupin domain-containing protein [Tyzzerella sp. OttesenSCG-928-J15]|nr:cupin domain-containing protein [Tyzzerella sp. OttesenSCG-928-J15]
MSGGKNYSITNLGKIASLSEKGRVMVGETLGMTGCEVSFNCTPAGKFTPFVHAHKLNEEIYIILSGNGQLKVDDEEFSIEEGNVIRIAPSGMRAFKAGDKDLTYICIQAQVDTLTQATKEDGIISEEKASWM